MLSRLLVDNLTVIGHAELVLGPGLTIVTGETGAGKTMLTTAISLVGGEKPDGRLVGPRGDEAYVEAEFTDPVPDALADIADPDEPLVLARRLRREGNARALCGGRSCSAEQLRAATDELISLTGQHAARRLADPAAQTDLLDSSAALLPAREEVAGLYRSWRASERDLASLRAVLADGVRKVELLRHEVELVRELDPALVEEDELGAESERLRHVDALRSAALAAAELLGGEDGVADGVASAQAQLEGAAAHDENIAALAAMVADAAESLADAARSARSLGESYEGDPARLDEVELRLSAISDLRRRFSGLDVESILIRTDESERELAEIEGGDERVETLAAECAQARGAYEAAATELTRRRKSAAKKLAAATEAHLHDLGLSGAKLLVQLEVGEPGVRGNERVRMLLAANRGLEPAPLDKGASGGELSRVNLALLLAGAAERGTWFFDEVDAGIGGNTAHVVAAKLKELSQRTQVIVVTHLAQIAVQADCHLVVRKDDADGVATTSVFELTDETERERELARLIGADSSDQQAASLATQLVRDAAAR